MTLEKARELLTVQVGFGSGYNRNAARLILAEVMHEHGQAAVDRLIAELGLQEAFGFAPMFTQAAGNGALRVIEETEVSLAFGIRARLAGVGFMPSRAWIGTDLLTLRPDVKTIADPYSGEELVAFPALGCDVAVIHALVADKRGNARLNKNLGIDPELAALAPQVIVTAEEVVDTLAEDVNIPGALVTAVVHAPRGAWPTSCYPHYPIGGGELLHYVEACANGQFDAYIRQFTGQNG